MITPSPPQHHPTNTGTGVSFLSFLFASHPLFTYHDSLVEFLYRLTLLLYFHLSFHATKPKHGRHNPISHWHISRKPINAFAFSPDLQHVAVVAADGELRIIDFRNELLIETFKSYFGALNCVCWSPDGKYILVRAEDILHTLLIPQPTLFLCYGILANKVKLFFCLCLDGRAG